MKEKLKFINPYIFYVETLLETADNSMLTDKSQEIIKRIQSRTGIYYTICKKSWFYDLQSFFMSFSHYHSESYRSFYGGYPKFTLTLREYQNLPSKYKGLFEINKDKTKYISKLPSRYSRIKKVKTGEEENFKRLTSLLNNLNCIIKYTNKEQAIKKIDETHQLLLEISRITKVEKVPTENGNLLNLLKDYAAEEAAIDAIADINSKIKNTFEHDENHPAKIKYRQVLLTKVKQRQKVY